MITVEKKEIELTVTKTEHTITVTPKRVTLELHRGLPGPKGDPGRGVPAGGTAGQVLAKSSSEDYETEWITGGSGSAVWGAITGDIEDQTDLQTALEEKADGTVIEALEAEIAAKADLEHTHEITDVTDLTDALAEKADTADLGTLAVADDAPSDGKPYARKNADWEEITAAAPAWGEITGDLEDQTDLQTALAGKAGASHTHAISDVTNLDIALSAKANTADLGTLAAADDAPADGKTYARKNRSWQETASAVWGAITGTLSSQTDLQNALDSVESHASFLVETLASAVETALAGKADTSHNHSAANITSGTLPIARGGTGGTTALTALENLIGMSKKCVSYTGTTESQIDTFLDSCAVLKCSSTQNASLYSALGDSYAYVIQFFYNGLTDTSTRLQIAFSHTRTSNAKIVFRVHYGSFSEWHVLDASDVLPIARGGTGVTANPSMLVNLASTSAASVFATSPRPGVTGTLPIARGGTGVTANPSMLVNLASTSAASVFAASPRPGVTGILPTSNGGTGGTDSGWNDYTNSTVFTYGKVRIRKIGNIVFLRATSLRLVNNVSASGYVTLLGENAIQSQFRPVSVHVNGFASTNDSSINGIRLFPIIVSTKGELFLYANKDTSIPSGKDIYLNSTYLV